MRWRKGGVRYYRANYCGAFDLSMVPGGWAYREPFWADGNRCHKTCAFSMDNETLGQLVIERDEIGERLCKNLTNFMPQRHRKRCRAILWKRWSRVHSFEAQRFRLEHDHLEDEAQEQAH